MYDQFYPLWKREKSLQVSKVATRQLMLGRRWLAIWVPSDSLIKCLTPFEDDTDIRLLNFLMYANSQKLLLSRWLHSKLISTLKFLSRLLTAKFQSARGASHHPAFMVNSLTIIQTCLPCPP